MTGEPSLNKIIGVLERGLLYPFITLLFSLATAVFIWGIVQFLANPEDAEKKEDGKRHMIWSIVGLTVMLGAWGIIGLIQTIWK